MLLLTKLWTRLEDIEDVVLKARARPRPPLWTLARAAIRKTHIQIQIQIQIQGDTNTSKHSASTLDTGPWCDLCGQPRCATTASAAPPPSHCASSPSTEGQHWIFLSLQHNFRKEPTPNLLPLILWEQRHTLSGMDPGWCSKVDLFGWRVFLRRRICCHVADGADPPMSRTRPTHTSFQLVSTASTILASFIAGLNFVGPAVSFVSNFPCCVSIFSLQPSSIHFNKTILEFRKKNWTHLQLDRYKSSLQLFTLFISQVKTVDPLPFPLAYKKLLKTTSGWQTFWQP